jgi:hypothetical protein
MVPGDRPGQGDRCDGIISGRARQEGVKLRRRRLHYHASDVAGHRVRRSAIHRNLNRCRPGRDRPNLQVDLRRIHGQYRRAGGEQVGCVDPSPRRPRKPPAPEERSRPRRSRHRRSGTAADCSDYRAPACRSRNIKTAPDNPDQQEAAC